MKTSKICVLLASLTGILFAASVGAQTCASPSAFNTPPTGPTDTGTTCGASDEVVLFCGSLDSSGKNDIIYQINVGPSKTATNITISGGAAGFTPTLFIYSDACNTANSCVATGDTATPADLSGVGTGTYFMALTAGSAEASGACGGYTITANGTLPVELKGFSVD